MTFPHKVCAMAFVKTNSIMSVGQLKIAFGFIMLKRLPYSYTYPLKSKLNVIIIHQLIHFVKPLLKRITTL